MKRLVNKKVSEAIHRSRKYNEERLGLDSMGTFQKGEDVDCATEDWSDHFSFVCKKCKCGLDVLKVESIVYKDAAEAKASNETRVYLHCLLCNTIWTKKMYWHYEYAPWEVAHDVESISSVKKKYNAEWWKSQRDKKK